MKRLSASEVARDLRDCEASFAECGDHEIARSYAYCAGHVERNLVPQWQNEPDGDGWYWVLEPDGHATICLLSIEKDGQGWIDLVRDEPLNGRQVCPVSPPPSES